jgi:hypothetical protein
MALTLYGHRSTNGLFNAPQGKKTLSRSFFPLPAAIQNGGSSLLKSIIYQSI